MELGKRRDVPILAVVRNRRLVASLTCALVLACGKEPIQPVARREPAVQLPQDGGRVIRRLSADVVTLNPVRVANALDRYVRKYLYTPIVYLDRDSQAVPGLAKSWKVSPDGLTYRFV
jgi:ABC-type transport system substrate-binding protein